MIGGRLVGEYRRVTLPGLVLTVVFWVVFTAVVAGLLVVAWPLVVAAGWAFAVAWLAGWRPRRLVVAAAWCLPMLVTFAVAYRAEGGRSWLAVAWSPVHAWVTAWAALGAGEWLRAMVVIAPAAIPAGLLIGAAAWRIRIGLMESGAAGWSPGAAVAFDERQWRRAVRTAAWRVRAPGGVPLLSRRGNPVLGATIRAVGHRPRPVLELPYAAMRSHMLVIGTTGAGKTTALVRLMAGFWAAATARYRRGGEARPWLVVIDAKGGFEPATAPPRPARSWRI